MVAPISDFSSFVGIGKETTYGTPVAATIFVPASTIASEDVKNYVPVTVYEGSAVNSYGQIPTQGWSTFNYDGPVFMDNVGYAFKSLLGDETTTGSGPFVHVLSTLNTAPMQPQSYTLVDYNGFEARSFPGCLCSQVEVNYAANALLTYSAQWMGLPSSAVTKPTQSFSAKTAVAAYKGVVTIAGSATAIVESATITFTRTVNPIIAINASTSPVAQFAADVSATGSMTIIYEDDTFLTPMLNGTAQSIEFSVTNGADILDIKGTSGLFTKAPVTRGGNGWMEVTVDFTLVANSTDAGASGGVSPGKVTVTNTTTGAL